MHSPWQGSKDVGLPYIKRAGLTPPSLQCPHFSRTLQSHSPVAARHRNSYGKWRGAEGGDDVPGEGQADLTPLPAAKCYVGSVVITQNRAIVCASSKRQSQLETCQGIAGAAIYSTGSHFGSCWHRTPLYLALFPFPHHSSCLLMLAVAWERDTGLDPARNTGRVWAERRKGPASSLGCKSESHHTWLSSNAQDTFAQRVPPSPAPAWQRLSGSEAAPAAALSLWEPSWASQCKDTSSHGEQLVLGNHLLLRMFCCQGPSRNVSSFSPNLLLTQPLSAPEQDRSRQTPAPDTPRQHGSFVPRELQSESSNETGFLGFPIVAIALGRPHCGFQASEPLQQTHRRLSQLCPSCPLAGHTQSLGGTVPLPVQPPRSILLLLRWGCPGGSPSWARGEGSPRQSTPTGGSQPHSAPLGSRQMPEDPGSPQGGDPPAPKGRLLLPPCQACFPHYGYIFITVVKGDQLHLYNIPLHKTNRPGNWDGPVKYFIVWTRGVRAAAHKLSQPQIPGITVLFLPTVPAFGLGAAWGWVWHPIACLPSLVSHHPQPYSAPAARGC